MTAFASQTNVPSVGFVPEVTNFAPAGVHATISNAKIGDKLTLKITRGSETKTLTVTLGENPNQKGQAYLGFSVSPAPMRILVDQNQQQPSSTAVNS